MSDRDLGVADRASLDALLDRQLAALMRCPTDGLEAQLHELVDEVARMVDVDHAALARPDSDGGPPQTAYQWVRPGLTPVVPFDPETCLPWIAGRLAGGTTVCLAKPDELPAEATADRAFLRRLGVRSVAALPLVLGGAPVGWLLLALVRENRPWPPAMMDQLRRIAEVAAGALARAQAEEALRRAVEFDQAVAGLAASLIRVPVDLMDAQIVQTLGRIGDLLGADRASVVQRDQTPGTLTRTHWWVRTGTNVPPMSYPEAEFPWLVDRVIGTRELVTVARLDDLPPEAARDRASLVQFGVTSGALAPMVVEDQVVGMLVFGRVAREQRWSPQLVARLRLVGEVIASALARRESELSLRAALAENEHLRERLSAENVYLEAELIEARDFGEIVGRSSTLLAALDKVRQVADTSAPVLLLGETGTGKELLARALHAQSRRRARSFIAVNCAALPATLIESELFGHEKGAFTGASHAKPGRFELADRGTLLLDEIGELEPAVQAKLLRALEEGEIQRLGSTVTRKVDIRIIAATNRDLRRDVRDGRFRSDLYYRLSVFPIEVAPLRDRREDIPLLVWHFIETRQRALGRTIKQIPQAAMAALQAYDWPGNIRELQNVIERAMILSAGTILRVEEALGTVSPDRDPGARRPPAAGLTAPEGLQETERAHIVQILERCRWTIEGRGQAADRLGLNPSTLRNRMRKLGIRRPAQ